ncbi:hypothetical protein R3P38DRAFT_3232262 [Favolaschia claudopus]|uniref:Uncharacterized protein n=1 Tax=Favolaschia claudopus TaxID=2862362 RepID=A0AAV9ZJD9_9AGAR
MPDHTSCPSRKHLVVASASTLVFDTLAEVSIAPLPAYNGYYPGYLPASRPPPSPLTSAEIFAKTSAKTSANSNDLRAQPRHPPDVARHLTSAKPSFDLRRDLRQPT